MLCDGVLVDGRGKESEVRELLKDCLRLLMLNSVRTLDVRLCGTGGVVLGVLAEAGEMGFLNTPPWLAWRWSLVMGKLLVSASSRPGVDGKAPGI